MPLQACPRKRGESSPWAVTAKTIIKRYTDKRAIRFIVLLPSIDIITLHLMFFNTLTNVLGTLSMLLSFYEL